jgi:ubiquinone/menaquinone biosynthesis C-methylase UbiE
MEQRVANEKAAHDAGYVYAASERLHQRFHHVFSCPNTMRMERHFAEAIQRSVPGKDVLSFGCGSGEEGLLLYSSCGARRIVGIDISEMAIRTATEKYGHLAEFYAMDGHHTDFPDASFDVVAGRAILHHLEFERGIREIHRLLRPGGYAIFQEPLRGNPVGTLLRILTPNARTTDELPLSGGQIAWADRYFGGACEHLFCNLLSVPVGMVTSLLPLSADNLALRAADKMDQLFAATPLRAWMRYSALCWQQRPA